MADRAISLDFSDPTSIGEFVTFVTVELQALSVAVRNLAREIDWQVGR